MRQTAHFTVVVAIFAAILIFNIWNIQSGVCFKNKIVWAWKLQWMLPVTENKCFPVCPLWLFVYVYP